MFEKTFESLLKGLDANRDPKTVFPASRKIDYNSRGMQYYNAEKEFMQLATDVGAQMQGKVGQLGLKKNPLQPFLNDVFIRKPKKQVDKSALNEEARTGFVDLFTRTNNFWDHSECKRNATTLFDIKGEGEKDGSEGRPAHSRENRKNLLLRVISKDSAGGEDAISPIYDPAKSPFRKPFGASLTVDAYKGGKTSGEPTPVLNKEDSFETSANFHVFKPPQSLTQIIASRDTLDDDHKDHKEDDRQEKLEKILKDKTENKIKDKGADRQTEKEAEKERLEEEIAKKKVEVWINAIPDFSHLFSQEIVESKSASS